MAAIDYDNLLDKLCAYLAARASLTYGPTPSKTSPNQLWRHSANEDFGTDPYTVLRMFGGSLPWTPVGRVSVQAKTIGFSAGAAFLQSQAIYGGLVDAGTGRPLRMAVIAAGPGGFRINGADPKQPPSLLTRDDYGRAEVVFNFDLSVVPLP